MSNQRRTFRKKPSSQKRARQKMRHSPRPKRKFHDDVVVPNEARMPKIEPTFLPFIGGGSANPMGMLNSLFGAGKGGGFPFGGGLPPMNPFGGMGRPPWAGGPSGMPSMNPFGGGQGSFHPFGGGMGGMNPFGMLFGGGNSGGVPMNLLWNMMSRFLW